MPTRQVESTNAEVRQSPPGSARAAADAGVESPSADRLRGANGLPHDSNADDSDSYADQAIDTAGTEADEQSVRHSALGLPKSDDRT